MPVLYQPWPLDSGDERRRAETATLSSNAIRPSPRHALHSTEKKPWAAPTSRARWRHAADSCRLPAMRRYPVASKLLQRSLGECSDAASAQTLTPCERRVADDKGIERPPPHLVDCTPPPLPQQLLVLGRLSLSLSRSPPFPLSLPSPTKPTTPCSSW
jgi:hypothetical protein